MTRKKSKIHPHMERTTLWDRCWVGLSVFGTPGKTRPAWNIIDIREAYVVLECCDSDEEEELGDRFIVHRGTPVWIPRDEPTPKQITARRNKIRDSWTASEERRRRPRYPFLLPESSRRR